MPGGSTTTDGSAPQRGGMGGPFGNLMPRRPGMGGGWGGGTGGMFNGGAGGSPGGFGGSTFPTMGNPGAQPQPTPGNPMTGNTTAAPGSPNPSNPMPGNFGMLGQLFGGGGANLANMNPVMNALSMALQGRMNQGG